MVEERFRWLHTKRGAAMPVSWYETQAPETVPGVPTDWKSTKRASMRSHRRQDSAGCLWLTCGDVSMSW